jgi:hypothetical protein
LLPTLSDARQRFLALVAANVLAVASRELAGEEAHLAEEWGLLAELLGAEGLRPEGLAALRQAVHQANSRLCERIRAGDFDAPDRFRAVSAAVRDQVVGKLEVANPRYLASARPG